MINVFSEVAVFEIDDTAVDCTENCIMVRNNAMHPERINLVVGNKTYVVDAGDVIAAVENAMHTVGEVK